QCHRTRADPITGRNPHRGRDTGGECAVGFRPPARSVDRGSRARPYPGRPRDLPVAHQRDGPGRGAFGTAPDYSLLAYEETRDCAATLSLHPCAPPHLPMAASHAPVRPRSRGVSELSAAVVYTTLFPGIRRVRMAVYAYLRVSTNRQDVD